jgi:hypothetical protein
MSASETSICCLRWTPTAPGAVVCTVWQPAIKSVPQSRAAGRDRAIIITPCIALGAPKYKRNRGKRRGQQTIPGVAEGVPAPFDQAALPKQQERGVVFLACNLAFALDCVPRVAKADNISEEEARKVALSHVLPGVLLQPSGVFAATRAQEAGCSYVKSS